MTQEEQSQERDRTGQGLPVGMGWSPGIPALRDRQRNHLKGSQQFCLAASWASCGGLLQGALISIYYPNPVAVISQLGGAQADSLL